MTAVLTVDELVPSINETLVELAANEIDVLVETESKVFVRDALALVLPA
jgi:hypothetical protein